MNIEGEAAISGTLRNRYRRYPGREDPRCDDGELLYPTFRTGFAIRAGSTVFTIGSAFARGVDRALVSAGLQVPTAAFTAPADEARGGAAALLNQYNPATMLQAVEAAGAEPHSFGLYPAGDDVVDALLSTGGRSVGRERAIERRAEIAQLYRAGLARAETILVTLGSVETWFDCDAALYLNDVPPRQVIRDTPGRFQFRRLDVGQCTDMVFALLDHLTAHGRRNVVLSVSPSPLALTVSGGDAVTATAHAKAILRVVAPAAVEAVDCVDYYPVYEIVGSAGLRAFGPDHLQVRPALVDQIVGRMLDAYRDPAASRQHASSAA